METADTATSQETSSRARMLPEQRPRAEHQKHGVGRFLFDIRYRRYRFRQFLGVALVFALTGWGQPQPTLLAIGAALACLGMGVRLWASGVVMKNEVLATSGPYGYVRHPLYVGNFLICVGFCFASALWWSVPLSIVFWLLFYPTTIRQEDLKLRGRFPEQWDHWASQTRPLWPRMSPYPGGRGSTSWSFKRSMLRNGEPLHVVVLGGCLLFLLRAL